MCHRRYIDDLDSILDHIIQNLHSYLCKPFLSVRDFQNLLIVITPEFQASIVTALVKSSFSTTATELLS